MKKTVQLIIVLLVSFQAIVAARTIEKTGTIHFRPEKNYGVTVDNATYYVSPGCVAEVADQYYGTSIVPHKSDVQLSLNEENLWYEVPVKIAIPDGNEIFCIYSKSLVDECTEYGKDLTECINTETVVKAKKEISVSSLEFMGNEDIYVREGYLYAQASTVFFPSIYVMTPESWSSVKIYSNNSGFSTALPNVSGDWYEVPSNLYFSSEKVHATKELGYRYYDVTSTFWYDQIEDCEDADTRACRAVKNAIDTVEIDSSSFTSHVGDILYTLNVMHLTPVLEKNGTKDTLIVRSYYGGMLEAMVNPSLIVDTLSIDSSLYDRGPEYIYYTVRVKSQTATYDTTGYDTTYQEESHYRREFYESENIYADEIEPAEFDTLTIADTLAVDSSRYLSYLGYIRYTITFPDSSMTYDTLWSDTLVRINDYYQTKTVYDTLGRDWVIEEHTYIQWRLGYIDPENILDTISIDSSDWSEMDPEYVYYSIHERVLKLDLKPRAIRYDNEFVFTNGLNSEKELRIDAELYNYLYRNHYTQNFFNTADFERDTVYIMESPEETGKTQVFYDRPRIQTIYVQLPSTIEWFSAAPMISFDGGLTGRLLTVDADRCGWYKVTFVNADQTADAKFYSATNKSLNLGKSAGDKKSFTLGELFKSGNTVFIDMNEGTITDDDPYTEGICNYYFTGIIYDTDASVNEFFSEYMGDNDLGYASACVGVHQGIVQDTLSSAGKPILNKGSVNAEACFGDEDANFDKLFNYTPGVNEGSCYSFDLQRMSDSRWGFSSDYSVTNKLAGGFYPVENKSDLDVFTDPLLVARKKRYADGPVNIVGFYSGVESVDKICNGPAWNGGIDCEGLFVEGNEEQIEWDWITSPTGEDRWVEELRNQHFCFESHASFVYQKGLHFTAFGDDDIWVFIAGRLAIDNGGTHLSAPGYADLDVVKDKNGKSLVEGQTYDFDLFFCDRRTTMSNMTFKTNIYLTQKERADLLQPCYVPDVDIFESSSSVASSSSGAETESSSSSAKDDDKVESSSSVASSSSSTETKSSSSSAKVEDKVESSSSVASSSSSAETKPSSSSAKVEDKVESSSSSAETKPSSSSAKDEDESSSSEGAGFVVGVNDGRLIVMPYGRTIQIAGSFAQASFAIVDMQGNVVRKGVLGKGISSYTMPSAGSYLVKVNGLIRIVNVK